MKLVPINPKPKDDVKPPRLAVRILRDGREICNQLTKEGRDEYVNRKRTMWERQGRMCCLHGHIASCPGKLNWADAVFAHEVAKGHGGGSTDDRVEIVVKGKLHRQNGVAHPRCNMMQGSRRINFNAAYNDRGDAMFDIVAGKTTNSGKVLFRCSRCGYETPAPTKNHKCQHN